MPSSQASIQDRFSKLRGLGEKALVLFVTAGDPPLAELPAILGALEEGGADLIEIGIPFSDPIADGPTIQASSQRALDRGVNMEGVLSAVKAASVSIPIVAMGYLNPILRMGVREAAQRFASASISGTIVSDLTPEEGADWIKASRDQMLDTIFLAAPTSTDARLDLVCKDSTGFVYAVSRTGVTGTGSAVPSDVLSLVTRIKERTQLPVCVGFGISKPEHVRMVCGAADGAVIGSWLVQWLAANWQGGAGRAALIEQIRELKAATR
ncbi:MAG: tryptophan synthase subunit alpha [Armatimonadetes bacterium]|nr:tryptophan synthase subunit alpha [Armatimonadota bacterium]